MIKEVNRSEEKMVQGEKDPLMSENQE